MSQCLDKCSDETWVESSSTLRVFNIFVSSDDATKKLENQEMQQQVNHDELLTDLAYIREKAKEVWEKIGFNSFTRSLFITGDIWIS